MSSSSNIPVIAIDGPSASGKGTVAQKVADALGYHYLDSGALYRIVALAAQQNQISWDDAGALSTLAPQLDIQFKQDAIYLDHQCVTEQVRSETMGKGASQVAVHPALRQALFDTQQNFRQAPGLVADGRDMASVIFIDAALKIFLTADVHARAQRRYHQLLGKGLNAKLNEILQDLQTRDLRDSQRTSAPLIQTADALLLDTSQRTIDDAVDFVLSAYKKRLSPQ